MDITNLSNCIEIAWDMPEDSEDGISTATKAGKELAALLTRIKELEDEEKAVELFNRIEKLER